MHRTPCESAWFSCHLCQWLHLPTGHTTHTHSWFTSQHQLTVFTLRFHDAGINLMSEDHRYSRSRTLGIGSRDIIFLGHTTDLEIVKWIYDYIKEAVHDTYLFQIWAWNNVVYWTYIDTPFISVYNILRDSRIYIVVFIAGNHCIALALSLWLRPRPQGLGPVTLDMANIPRVNTRTQ